MKNLAPLFVVLLIGACSFVVASDKVITVTVFDRNTYQFGIEDYKGIAVAKLSDSHDSNGWSQLNITTNAKFTDEEQSFAAGLAEGLISYYHTFELYQNQVFDWNFTESTGSVKRDSKSNYLYPKGIIQYLVSNLEWVRQEAKVRKNNCKFWYHVQLLLDQFDGLVEGHLIMQNSDIRISSSKRLDWFDLYVLQSAGDMYSLVDAFGNTNKVSSRVRQEAFTQGVPMEIFQSRAFTRKYKEDAPYTECSALIKITSSNNQKCDNLFVGHTTWRRYNIINKFFKVCLYCYYN